MKRTLSASLLSLSLILLACSASDVNAIKAGLSATTNTTSSTGQPASKQTAKVKITAAVIRGDGNVVPVAKTNILFYSYNASKLDKELFAKNSPGREPEWGDFHKDEKGNLRPNLGLEDFNKAHKEWEQKAYAGREDAAKKISRGEAPFSVTTDLSGNAEKEIPVGKWYVTANYKLGSSMISWTDAEFDIKPDTTKIELSNDNAQNIF